MPTHLCGAGFAFLGFCGSLLIGLFANNSFVTVVLRATAVMALFYVLGFTLSAIGQKAVQENFEAETAALNTDADQQPDSSDNPNQTTEPQPQAT